MISKLLDNDDIGKAAQLIYITASDLFNIIFSRKKALGSLSCLISEQGNMFGLANVTVYKENNTIVGVIVGHSGKDEKLFRKTERKAFIKSVGRLRTFHYYMMIVPVLKWLMKLKNNENEFYISNIGVDENYRGRGIGTELIKYIISEQQNKGIEKIYLDVEGKNINAIKLYENLGFRIKRQRSIGLLKKKTIVLTMCLNI